MKVVKAQNDFAKAARSFNPKVGKKGGSTKDAFKEKVVEEAKKHGISKRTAENAIAKTKGPTQSQRKPKTNYKAMVRASEELKLQQDIKSGWVTPEQAKHAAQRIEKKYPKTPSPVTPQAPLPQSKRQGDVYLLKTIEVLEAQLAREKSLRETLQETIKTFDSFLEIMPQAEWVKLRRTLAKTFHPDVNPNKTFTAGEVMAILNPLLKASGEKK